MKTIQSIVLAAIVLGTSACASNAVKQSPAASLSEPQATTEAVVGMSSEASSAPGISATELPASQGRVPDQMASRESSTDVESPEARQVIGEDPSAPLAVASNDSANGSPADAGALTSAEEDAEALYPTQVNDPWERYNRGMYTFNTKVDKYIARPIGVAYDWAVPNVVQRRVTSFFANLQEPRNMVNQLLQGRPVGAARTLGRFVLNTTAGVGGIFDPASKLNLDRANEDFGQTLAVWGWEDSRYFVVPLQGPRTVRDFVGSYGDKPAAPSKYIDDDGVSMGLKIVQLGSMRAAALPIDKLRAEAFDEYVFVRDAWMQRRKHLVEEKR